MPVTTPPAAPPTPTTLLAAWEAAATPAQLAAQAPYRAVVLAWLTTLHQMVASAPPLPGEVDMDDAYTIMRGAGAIRAAQTETTGSTRAAAAVRQLLAALPPSVDGQPARRALLYIVSGPAAELEIDELSEITDTTHNALLHDNGEMIFGHGELTTVAVGALQVWLLLSY